MAEHRQARFFEAAKARQARQATDRARTRHDDGSKRSPGADDDEPLGVDEVVPMHFLLNVDGPSGGDDVDASGDEDAGSWLLARGTPARELPRLPRVEVADGTQAQH